MKPRVGTDNAIGDTCVQQCRPAGWRTPAAESPGRCCLGMSWCSLPTVYTASCLSAELRVSCPATRTRESPIVINFQIHPPKPEPRVQLIIDPRGTETGHAEVKLGSSCIAEQMLALVHEDRIWPDALVPLPCIPVHRWHAGCADDWALPGVGGPYIRKAWDGGCTHPKLPRQGYWASALV